MLKRKRGSSLGILCVKVGDSRTYYSRCDTDVSFVHDEERRECMIVCKSRITGNGTGIMQRYGEQAPPDFSPVCRVIDAWMEGLIGWCSIRMHTMGISCKHPDLALKKKKEEETNK